MFISDIILAYMWSTTQSFPMRPIIREEYLENLQKVVKKQDFPALDIFICTADPFKEPPVNVVNTALSVMAYDYPTEKISVYVSDDGGSELPLFAFMEAAKFGKHWLPFCRQNNIMDRCPEAYFRSNFPMTPDSEKIKGLAAVAVVLMGVAVEFFGTSPTLQDLLMADGGISCWWLGARLRLGGGSLILVGGGGCWNQAALWVPLPLPWLCCVGVVLLVCWVVRC